MGHKKSKGFPVYTSRRSEYKFYHVHMKKSDLTPGVNFSILPTITNTPISRPLLTEEIQLSLHPPNMTPLGSSDHGNPLMRTIIVYLRSDTCTLDILLKEPLSSFASPHLSVSIVSLL